MPSDEVVEYYRALQQSGCARGYWVGISPDDDAERWLFETVEDGEELVVVRQLTVGTDGTRRQYSVDHFEDEWGFLTDQPLDPADELTRCSRE